MVAYVPLSIFGGLAAVAIGAFFAAGFGTPLISWAWPVLFVRAGAGVPHRVDAARRDHVPPDRHHVRRDGARSRWCGRCERACSTLFLGTTNVAGVGFVPSGRARSSYLQLSRWDPPDSDDTVTPTVGDWTLSLGIAAVAVVLGIYLANQVYAGFGS